MKRILIATGLALGLLAATANDGRASGCCGCGPGFFSIGLKLDVAWGHGGGCCAPPPCYAPPAVYGAAPYGYPGPGYGPAAPPVGPYGYGPPAPGYGYGGYGAPAADYSCPGCYGGY